MTTIGSLFSGIGGLELGLERAGLGPVMWQVEVDPFCRAVLAKHWPNVTRYEDVTQPRIYPHVDLVCGGFPCQDVSAAGDGAGLSGARSGLWYHYARIVEQIRPNIVVVENVTSGKRRWLPAVRHQLHMLGYRTTAYALSAADVGAPHLRRRVFVVAYAERMFVRLQPGGRSGTDGEGETVSRNDGAQGDAATLGHALLDGRPRPEGEGDERRSEPATGGWWASEPDVGRVVDGLPGGMDGRRRRARLRALGNAVVPACAEVIGRLIARQIGDYEAA